MSKNPVTSLARLKLSLQLFHSHIHGAHAHLYRMSYHSNRGGGFYRGRRGGNNWGRGRSQERNYSDNAGDDGGRSYSGRPRGLRGREIGMFYARRSQAKKKHEEEQQKPVLQMDRTTERRIRNLLEDINNSENVPAQPVQSGASLSDNGDNTARPKTAPPSSTMKGACYMDMDMPSSSATEDPDNGHTTSTCSLQDYNQELDSNGELITSTQVNDYDVTTYESEKREQLSVMNELLFKDLKQKTENSKYQKMLHFRKKLPSYNMRQEIVDTINSNQVVVISGETGCGKTTQVPQFILDDFISKGQGSLCRVVCTQPRRISAVSVAERVADERNEPCGNSSVGYSIRLERKLPKPHGSILFCTTGILLKYLESDRNLLRATHIVIDEIHERDLMSDFLMIVLKDLLPVRTDLKVVLMSATLNAEQFSKYFNDCPMLNIPGFTYPVQEYYLENVLEMLRYDPPEKKQRKKKFHGQKWRENREKELEEEEELYTWSQTLRGKFSEQTIESLLNMDEELIDIDLMYSLIQHICFNLETGAILVFVPGWKEIGDLHKLLMKDSMFSSSKFRIIPLHSMMPTVNQREVFDRPPEGVRKIVIATNIAETSITIDDVVFVIDCGKIKVKDFQPDVNLATLEAQWVSQANARQRRGRAGRVQPGHCFHLYSSYRDQKLRDYLPPEILRTRLEELCLQIKLLKFGKIEPFVGKAMQPPSFEALHQAITTLQNLEALDEEENLLPLGYHLARMPAVDPHSGKMILFGAMFGCLDPICTVAASLSFKDAFVIPLGKEAIADERRRKLANGTLSDHLMLINAFKGWERAKSRGTQSQYCWDNFLSQNVLHMLHQMKGQYADLLKDLGFIQSRKIHDDTANINSENENLIKAIIVAGLYPNVAKIAKLPNPRSKFPKPVKLQLKNDIGKVAIHPKSVNSKEKHFQSKWLIFHKLMKTNGVYVFDCSVVSPYPLLFFGGKIGNSISIVNGQRKNLVTIDDWISFYASDSITNIVKDLKQQLNGILEAKIQNPCPTNWKGSNKEGAIMRAIIDLITTEEIVQLQHYDYDDD